MKTLLVYLQHPVHSAQTLTASVIDNDFDPGGNSLTTTGFINNDDRILVKIVNNELSVTFNNSSTSVFSIDVLYTVSYGNGGTAKGVLTVFRSAPVTNG